MSGSDLWRLSYWRFYTISVGIELPWSQTARLQRSAIVPIRCLRTGDFFLEDFVVKGRVQVSKIGASVTSASDPFDWSSFFERGWYKTMFTDAVSSSEALSAWLQVWPLFHLSVLYFWYFSQKIKSQWRITKVVLFCSLQGVVHHLLSPEYVNV